MNRKTNFILAACILAGGTFSQAGQTGVKAGEFLSLTRETIPSLQAVIQGAMDATRAEKVPLHVMKKRARRSALLPRLRIRADYDLDAYDNYGYVEDARVYTYDGGNQQDGRTKSDRWERTDQDDRFSYGAYAEWDLRVFIWEKQDQQLAQQYAKQGGVLRRRVVEVSKRYAALISMLPRDDSGSVASSDIADVLDNAIYLDAVTDQLLSDTLNRLQAAKEAQKAMDQVTAEDIEVVDHTEAAEVEPAPPAEEPAADEASKASDEEKNEMLNFLHSI
jgi:hypothetical protein